MKTILSRVGILYVGAMLLGFFLLGTGLYGPGFLRGMLQTIVFVTTRVDIILRTIEVLAGSALIVLVSIEFGKWIQRRADEKTEK